MGIGVARAVSRESEPRFEPPDAELERLYEGLRRFRAWGFFIGTSLMLALMHVCAALVAWGPAQLVAWVGALGGASIGILGGVFGTMADLRRVKIQERLRSLSLENVTSVPEPTTVDPG